MNIIFFPVFTDNREITDHYYRLHWYLYPFKDRITHITLLHTLEDTPVGPVPNYLGDNLGQLTNRFPEVQLVKAKNSSHLRDLVKSADFIFLWSTDHNQPDRIPECDLKPVLKSKKIIRIDHKNEQFAGSFYLKFAENFTDEIYEATHYSKKVFERIVERCSNPVGYIFGTGPGLSYASQHDFSDGVSIACNSMVRNHALLDRLNPPIFVVGDPIFHAGPSSYAAEFRSELIPALDKYDAALIVPMRDYHIYRTHLPERFKDRIAAIPFKPGHIPNLDLEKSFHVTTTSNILTLFLIPLATTLFNEVRIFGCDGRPAKENTYFWKHDKSSQFNEQMIKIQEAHPAFFVVDYDDYYFTHCRTLEKWFAKAERYGKSFLNMSPTYIPALISRNVDGILELDEDYKVKDTDNNGRKDKNSISLFSRGLNFNRWKMGQKVTVIMPAFNAENFIEIAVKSVIDQDFKNWELLVIDDSSTDSTAEIIKRVSKVDFRIKLLKNSGRGVSSARNTGIENATGNFICFLDADDALERGALTARIKVFCKKKELVLVHGATRLIDEVGRDLDFIIQKNRTIRYEDMSSNPVHLNSVMGRAFFIKKFRFEEGITNGEDWWFFARLLRSGAKSDFVVHGGATYRVHKNSTVLKNMEQHENVLSHVIDWIYKPSSEKGVSRKYEKGLQSPCKNDVLVGRTNNVLVWCILCGDEDKANYVMSEKLPIGWSEHWTETRLRNVVALAGIRYFGQPRKQLHEVSDSARQLVLDTIKSIKLKLFAPKLADAFIEIFALDCLIDFPKEELKAESTDLKEHLSVCHPREVRAHVDETRLVAYLFNDTCKRVMVSVEKNFEKSTCPFLGEEWQIVYFNPNSENVKSPIKHLRNDKNGYFESGKSAKTSNELAFCDRYNRLSTVNVMTLTDEVKDNDINHIDVLKIDDEGCGFSVLKGFLSDQIKPVVVECKFHDAKSINLEYTWRDVADYLIAHGYSIYVSEWHPIIQYGIRHDWRQLTRYPCELADSNAWGNLLAFKDDPGTAALQEAMKEALKVEHPEILDCFPSHIQKNTDTIAPLAKKVNRLTHRLSGFCMQKIKMIMKQRLLWCFSSYVHFAEWIRTKNMTLFRIGQFVMWTLRFHKQHSTASVIGAMILSVLILTPILIPQLASYASYFWTTAALLFLLSSVIIGISFVNEKIMEFVDREHHYRQILRAEMMRELQRTQEQLEARVEAQARKQMEFDDSLKELRTLVIEALPNQSETEQPDKKFGGYQSFNRCLTKMHIDLLQHEWSRKLDLKVTPRSLAYLAHRICTLESVSRGRLAATIEDAVLRVLIAMAVKDTDLRVLEIGTLFGVGLAAIYEHTSSRFNSVHLTAIDPLDGYYGNNTRDIVTDEVVNEPIFRENLARAGASDDEVTLIKIMSTDRHAMQAANKSLHNVLIIDGDHSYAGVKADFVNYLPVVQKGGYIIFDDYDSSDWPDVKDFVDANVRSNPDVTLIGASWHTAVFQVV